MIRDFRSFGSFDACKPRVCGDDPARAELGLGLDL